MMRCARVALKAGSMQILLVGTAFRRRALVFPSPPLEKVARSAG